jgi:16S rRNA (cytosine1402-N4)-methyltransferase
MAIRSTPAGEHVPVMLAEVLHALDVKPGETAVDCTLGAAGHAAELLRLVGTTGRLIAVDLDSANLEPARMKLREIGDNFELHTRNFAGLTQWLPDGTDVALADLGVSSMQIDDPLRGFSYRRSGPLDMRMDPKRGRTAAELLRTLSVDELTRALDELGDFAEFGPNAAQQLAAAVKSSPPNTTDQLTNLILRHVPPPPPPPGKLIKPWQLKYRPVACAYQALRILVNRELANLSELLRILPAVLRPGGRIAIISFHSGEDRLVKQSFREGMRNGVYSAVADDAIRAGYQERQTNPRSRSAKLRWARRGNNPMTH